MDRDADGALVFLQPNGWSIPDVPDPPVLPHAPIDVLRDATIAHGVRVDSHTLTPGWRGEGPTWGGRSTSSIRAPFASVAAG
jgi:hypothetical protein